VRFVDLLKSTVLLSAAAATLLAIVTVVEANALEDDVLVFFAAGWWFVAGLVGGWLGRRKQPTQPVERALREARTATSLPEPRAGRVLLNRLWPLLLVTFVAAVLSILWPQIAAIATGFNVLWALSWRHQEAAVSAVEERDGATFFVESTSIVGPIKLVRTPGLRRDLPPARHGV
jgi:hypothetical protein